MNIIWALTFVALGWMGQQFLSAQTTHTEKPNLSNENTSHAKEVLIAKAMDQLHLPDNTTSNLGSNTLSWIIEKSSENLRGARHSHTTSSEENNSIQANYNAASELENHAKNAADYKKAISLYELAAKKGDSRAQSRLGIAYLKGQLGLKNNEQEAEKWLTEAAIQNELNAQYYLGKLLLKDIETDKVDALVWIAVAAKRGHESAQEFIKEHWTQLNSEQKDELLSRVRQWNINDTPAHVA